MLLHIDKLLKRTLLVTAIALITACGGSGGNSNNGQGSDEPAPTNDDPVAPNDDPVTPNDDPVAPSTPTEPLEVIFIADKDTAEMDELFHSTIDGAALSRLSDALIPQGDVIATILSPNKHYVAYLADQASDEVFEIYVASTLGSVKVSTQLMPGTIVKPLAWAADNSRLLYGVFPSLLSTGAIELYTVRPDGTDNESITGTLAANDFIEQASWAPNSGAIAYLINRTANDVMSELYTVGANGSDNTRVSGDITGADITDFSWSPDSLYIAYRADASIDQQFELYSVRPDGTALATVSAAIAPDQTMSIGMFAWAPDSDRVAYIANQDIETTQELYISTPDGNNNNKISGPLAAGGHVFDFAWAPDGSRIAYQADQNTDGVSQQQLFTATPDGSDNNLVSGPLTDSGDVIQFAWAPDSSRLAYRADQQMNTVYELYTSTPEGNGNNTRVSSPDIVEYSDVIFFEWAPDSSRLAYRADLDTNSVFELYTSTPDSSANIHKVSAPLIDGRNVFYFEWASNSNYLIYLANQDTANVIELYSAPADADNSSNNLSGTLTPGGNVMCLNESCNFVNIP